MKKINKAFTLIEVIISVSIFSIIMISVITIYIISNDVSIKSDVNRAMQENLKVVLTEIGEGIIKDGIKGVSNNSITEGCDLIYNTNKKNKEGAILCLQSSDNYFLAKKNIITGNFDRVSISECKELSEQCYIAKTGLNQTGGEPLTNSLVSVKDLNFIANSAYGINKITILIELEPSIKSGMKAKSIEDNKFLFQTTISERPLITK